MGLAPKGEAQPYGVGGKKADVRLYRLLYGGDIIEHFEHIGYQRPAPHHKAGHFSFDTLTPDNKGVSPMTLMLHVNAKPVEYDELRELEAPGGHGHPRSPAALPAGGSSSRRRLACTGTR